MRHRNVPIYQLERKVTAMTEVLFQSGQIATQGRSALAEFAGVNIKTLNSSIAVGGATKEVQEKLARACNFATESRSWIDTTLSDDERRKPREPYPGLDAAENFHQHLRVQNGLDTRSPTQLFGDRPNVKAPDLASFALSDFGQSTPPGEAVLIFLEVDLTPGLDEWDYEYGFSRIRIRPKFPSEPSIEIKERLGHQDPCQIGNAKLEGKGTEYHPYWEISTISDNGVLEGDYSTRDGPLFKLKVPGVPYHFSAELRVRLRDGTLRAKGEKPLPKRNKRLIIQRLIALMLEDELDVSGWQTLGSQSLTIRRLDR